MASSETLTELMNVLEDLMRRATAAGADAADAGLSRDSSLSLGLRLGQREKLERSESQDVSLRVFVGKRQAMVSTSDLSTVMLDELAQRAVAMARAVPEDPFCGPAEPELLARSWPELEALDPNEPSEEVLSAQLQLAEEAARAVPGVTNSEGAEAGWGRVDMALIGSNGFSGNFSVTRFGLSVSVIAGEGTEMERDYDYSSTVFGADLADPVALGKAAGERAVKRLHPRKVPTAKLPIIFDPRVSNGLVSHFIGAINGGSIARGTSFLKEQMGQKVFADGITIVDDPHRPRGLRSKPFDGEGVANHRSNLIDDGVLQSWILGCREARQLGLKSTGHGSRGGSPSASNVYMQPGKLSAAEMIKSIDSGFYVTELIGHGVNGVTGDYSRGAAGFWIEQGVIAYPVSEVTIAGNLKEMFRQLTPASDLVFRYGIDAPTLRIDGMTIAGA
ncbi:MAG TPA: metallopeptidase TldD-related protein [Dongiaceae bacterium]